MTCWVPYCDSYVPWKKGEKRKPGLSFHKFPSDLDMKKRWIVAIGRKDLATGTYTIPYKNSCICNLHFSPSQLNTKSQNGSLKAGSIPYIFPTHTLPQYGTLIDEKELALVNITEEEHTKILQENRKKHKEKKAKAEIRKSNLGFVKIAKKRSFSEIESVKLIENTGNKINKTDVADNESDEGNNFDCGFPNSDDFSLSDDESSKMNKNINIKDKTKESFSTINFTQLFEQGILKSFNDSKTNSAIKTVKLPLSLPEKKISKDESKQTFLAVNSLQLPRQNSIPIVNKAISTNKSNPAIKILTIPFSIPDNSKIVSIQIPSAIGSNTNLSSCAKKSVDLSPKANVNSGITQGNNTSLVINNPNKNLTFINQINSMKLLQGISTETTLGNFSSSSINSSLKPIFFSPTTQGNNPSTIVKKQNNTMVFLNQLKTVESPQEIITKPTLKNPSIMPIDLSLESNFNLPTTQGNNPSVTQGNNTSTVINNQNKNMTFINQINSMKLLQGISSETTLGNLSSSSTNSSLKPIFFSPTTQGNNPSTIVKKQNNTMVFLNRLKTVESSQEIIAEPTLRNPSSMPIDLSPKSNFNLPTTQGNIPSTIINKHCKTMDSSKQLKDAKSVQEIITKPMLGKLLSASIDSSLKSNPTQGSNPSTVITKQNNTKIVLNQLKTVKSPQEIVSEPILGNVSSASIDSSLKSNSTNQLKTVKSPREIVTEPTLEITSRDSSLLSHFSLHTTQCNKSNTIVKKQNKVLSFMKQVKSKKFLMEIITEPTLENLTENDKSILNELDAELIENQKLTIELIKLQEEKEDAYCSDDSLEEKINLYGIKELKTGIANGDKKCLFLYDQLQNLTGDKTMWSDTTEEFANSLEENLPACHDFLKKTNIISLPPPKNQRDDHVSQMEERTC